MIPFTTGFFLLLLVTPMVTTFIHLPDDHRAHENFGTEWWYYTGNLNSHDGHQLAYELTFFKVNYYKRKAQYPDGWKPKSLYISHFAVSDITNKKFYYHEMIHRPLGQIAGHDNSFHQSGFKIWNNQWSVTILNDKHTLIASTPQLSINLTLTPLKKPVFHGNHGMSYKGDDPDQFSYYYSFSRLKTSGIITINDNVYHSNGLSWMDHEWMPQTSIFQNDSLSGWDWFSIQLSNNVDIMIYMIRDLSGQVKSVSSGTIIYPDGSYKKLSIKDFQIKRLKYWQSPNSSAIYPIKWELKIPSEEITVHITPYFENQELDTRRTTQVIYWEGAVQLVGKQKNKNITGKGFVEMTGYSSRKKK